MFLYIPFAVGGGADLVRNFDTALGRKPSSKADVTAAVVNTAEFFFQTVTNALEVSGGVCRAVEGLDPAAAT